MWQARKIVVLVLVILLPSSIAQSNCPSPDAIAPCICEEPHSLLILDCSLVESEQQLESIFEQEFPKTEFDEFHMSENLFIKTLNFSTNGISFVSIDLFLGPFVLEEVTEEFLIGSAATLETIRIHNSNVTTEKFPFDSLSSFPKLDLFDLSLSDVTWLPKVDHDRIRVFSFGQSSIASFDPGFLHGLPNLQDARFHSNEVSELKTGTFPITNSSHILDISLNNVANIEAGAFYDASNGVGVPSVRRMYLFSNNLTELRAGSLPFTYDATHIFLYDNKVSYVEPGTFYVLSEPALDSVVLDFTDNSLPVLEEGAFAPIMPYVETLWLTNNPLECGCDIAWFVTNPAWLGKVDYRSTCSNGTHLFNLNPEYYQNNC